jgi:nicotinamidase/pyrazinamidase
LSGEKYLKRNLDLKITAKDALIITDIQLDFLPGGALPVPDGDQVIPVFNEYIRIFKGTPAKIVASRDWHLQNHVSFKSRGGPWPSHCVQETPGAQFSPALKLPENTGIISKATDSDKEAYSVFDSTGLADTLNAKKINRIFIGGLATDYCIVNSVLDARKLGLHVIVLVDGSRGINVRPGDVEEALDSMMKSGAQQVTLSDFPEPEDLAGEETAAEVIGDKPLTKVDVKKKARMRPKGSYKQVRRERG